MSKNDDTLWTATLKNMEFILDVEYSNTTKFDKVKWQKVVKESDHKTNDSRLRALPKRKCKRLTGTEYGRQEILKDRSMKKNKLIYCQAERGQRIEFVSAKKPGRKKFTYYRQWNICELIKMVEICLQNRPQFVFKKLSW